MENKAHALAAGIFAILFGVAVVLALFWFGGSKEKTTEYLVVTQQNVTGLNPQAQVRYRGIRVGKVKDIRLERSDVRNTLILIEVDETVPVTQGTIAKLGYQGVTGLAHVQLEENGKDATPLRPDAQGSPPRIAMAQSLFDELGETGSAALKQARTLFANANALLSEENRQHFSGALANLEASTAQLNRLLADQRIHRLGSAIGRIDEAADNANVFFRDARLLLPKVGALSDKLDGMIGDPTSDGAMAAVGKLNDLARDLSTSTRQLNRVLRGIEDSPQSLLFGRPVVAPGPGEPGFVAPNIALGKP